MCEIAVFTHYPQVINHIPLSFFGYTAIDLGRFAEGRKKERRAVTSAVWIPRLSSGA